MTPSARSSRIGACQRTPGSVQQVQYVELGSEYETRPNLLCQVARPRARHSRVRGRLSRAAVVFAIAREFAHSAQQPVSSSDEPAVAKFLAARSDTPSGTASARRSSRSQGRCRAVIARSGHAVPAPAQPRGQRNVRFLRPGWRIRSRWLLPRSARRRCRTP